MPLILAIEPDRLQAGHLSAMVRGRLRAELVLADAAETALAQLGDRVPDLVLTSALLSTKDETALADWLRTLDGGAAHVPTLTIPVLEAPAPRQSTGRTGIFSLALLNDRVSSPAAPDGCDPAVFAEQCAEYLDHARKERAHDNDVVEVEPPVLIETPVFFQPVLEPPTVVEQAPRTEDAIVEPPPPAAPLPMPPQIAEAANEGVEIDLSAMLDESVFQQLSEAIETVSRDTPRSASTSSSDDVWTPSSLGSEAVWPAMDFSPSPRPHQSAKSAASRSQPTRFPARKPIQDEWGFFDPAQCGFSALLAKLDEITRE